MALNVASAYEHVIVSQLVVSKLEIHDVEDRRRDGLVSVANRDGGETDGGGGGTAQLLGRTKHTSVESARRRAS